MKTLTKRTVLFTFCLIIIILVSFYKNRDLFIEHERWKIITQLDSTWNQTKSSEKVINSISHQVTPSNLVMLNKRSSIADSLMKLRVVSYSINLDNSKINSQEKVRFGINYPLGFKIELNNQPIKFSPNFSNDSDTGKLTVILDHRINQNEKIEWFILSKLPLNDSENELKVSFYFTEDLTNEDLISFHLEAGFQGLAIKPIRFTTQPTYNEKDRSQLPQINIQTTKSDIPDEPKIKGNMVVKDIDNGINTFNIKIEKRGTSSQRQSFKNSYTLNIYDDNWDKLHVELLGLKVDRKWVLYAPYYDKSLIRNAFTYTIAGKLNWYCPSIKKCELFVNGDYKGVYFLTEKITHQESKLDIKKDGFIAQVDRPESDEFGFYIENANYTNHPYITFNYPNSRKLNSTERVDIKNSFFKIDSLFNNTGGINKVWEYVDINSFTDLFIFNELSHNIDAYRLSTFMYKRSLKIESKLRFGPLWDFNHGYGNCLPIHDYKGWAFKLNNPEDEYTMLNWWESAFNNSDEFRGLLQKKWTIYRQEILSHNNILQTIDSLAFLGPKATERNFKKISVLDKPLWWNKYAGGTYENEIYYLNCWIVKRSHWLDKNISMSN